MGGMEKVKTNQTYVTGGMAPEKKKKERERLRRQEEWGWKREELRRSQMGWKILEGE